MVVSDLFVSGLDAGDDTGCDETETLCKQRTDQWSIMYDLWCCNRNIDHIRTGIAAVLAVPGSHDRGDSHGMDRWTYDRTVLP